MRELSAPVVVKYKKAPEAPRRFKSSYMFFSTVKHKEIRAELIEKYNEKGRKVSASLYYIMLCYVMLYLYKFNLIAIMSISIYSSQFHFFILILYFIAILLYCIITFRYAYDHITA